MKKFAVTMLAALAIFASSAITQVARAMEPREVVQTSYEMEGIMEQSSRALYAGICNLPINTIIPNSRLPKTPAKGWVYRNVEVKRDAYGFVKSIHVKVFRHVIKDRYEAGDKATYGLTGNINYSDHPKIVYDVRMSPLSDTGHNCYQDISGLWVFRIGNTDEYWALEPDGRVRPFTGRAPIYVNR